MQTDISESCKIELMTFSLNSSDKYGINIFKIREIMTCPTITRAPGMSKNVIGITSVRGKSIPIIDLSLAVGFGKTEDPQSKLIMITEISNSTQAFLVDRVDQILKMEWSMVEPLSEAAGNDHFLTGVAKIKDEMIGIIDIEKVLSNIYPSNNNVSDSLKESVKDKVKNRQILVVDDSNIARKQLSKTVLDLGFVPVVLSNGDEALKHLLSLAQSGPVSEKIAMVVSDIEMPIIDGCTLTAEIKNNPDLKDLYVVLHTSLSGNFNKSLVESVGADDFVSKFDAEVLGAAIQKGL